MKFDVRFTFSRFPLRNMQRALEIIGKTQKYWKNFLFPDPPKALTGQVQNVNVRVSRLMEQNPEQKLAVSLFASMGHSWPL